jgi:DNA-binding protein YbaB
MSQLTTLQNALGGGLGALGGGLGGGLGALGGLGGLGGGLGGQPSAEIVGTAGGGAVRIRATGDLEFIAVEIDPAVVDPDDVAVLEDLVLAAVRDVAEQLRRATESTLGQALGGALSGLFGAIGESVDIWDDDDDDEDDEDEDDEDEDEAGEDDEDDEAGDGDDEAGDGDDEAADGQDPPAG